MDDNRTEHCLTRFNSFCSLVKVMILYGSMYLGTRNESISIHSLMITTVFIIYFFYLRKVYYGANGGCNTTHILI